MPFIQGLRQNAPFVAVVICIMMTAFALVVATVALLARM
ncbi:MAG: hypothetical protein JWP87_3801 [Labilithrix sp.]|jgi:hypothetical protein|nr:hypothetical protein [Labilithrix sp.]